MSGNGEDNEEEWEEEEQLLVVHLSGIIDTEYLKKCDPTNCKVLGIDTDEPVLQIDKMCFHGSYDDCIGTNLIFEEQSDVVDDKVQKNLKYMCHTTKNLDMIRVFFKKEDDIQSKNLGEASTGLSTNQMVKNVARDKVQGTSILQHLQGLSGNDSSSDYSKEIEVQLEMLTQHQQQTRTEEANGRTTASVDPMDCT